MRLNRTERQLLRDAVNSLTGYIVASDYAARHPADDRQPGQCAVFDRTFAPKDECSRTEAARLAKQSNIFIESWVEPNLRVLLKLAEGLELTDDEQDLYDYTRMTTRGR